MPLEWHLFTLFHEGKLIMPHNLLIRNGRIIDPESGIDAKGDLYIVNSRITEPKDAGYTDHPDEFKVINAERCVVCPGFVDLHCHLREPGAEEKETIATGTQAAARGGFTTVCCMPNTNPPLDNEATINYVKRKAGSEGAVRVLPVGCITRGRNGKELVEMNDLANAGVIGFSDDGNPVESSRIMYLAMQYSTSCGLPIIEHCEDKELSEGGVVNEGWIATRLGLKGIPSVAEENVIARDIALARISGASLHIAHTSTRGSVQLIRQAKENGVNISAEVTPHHLTLTQEWVMGPPDSRSKMLLYDTNAKVNPPLRTQEDIESLIEGLKDGTIDAIATDHAPHTLVDKNCEFDLAAFGISNFETAFASLLALVDHNLVDLKTLISCMTYKPAKIIGTRFGKFGNLKPGNNADITIFDPEFEWIIDYTNFLSKGRNTPLHGQKVKGKVLYTIYNGELAYQHQSNLE